MLVGLGGGWVGREGLSRDGALTFAGQAVGGDPRQRLPAHVAEGGPGVRAGVPVVHPGEVLHVELASLEGDASPVSALATF